MITLYKKVFYAIEKQLCNQDNGYIIVFSIFFEAIHYESHTWYNIFSLKNVYNFFIVITPDYLVTYYFRLNLCLEFAHMSVHVEKQRL